jgi:transketolase
MGMAGDRGGALGTATSRTIPVIPHGQDRDRFVLSNGHGSMLLYSLLHLTGYDLPMSELKRFRQLHSKTPGHPELGCAPGVETTTGPLGPGHLERGRHGDRRKLLAAEFNRPGHESSITAPTRSLAMAA